MDIRDLRPHEEELLLLDLNEGSVIAELGIEGNDACDICRKLAEQLPAPDPDEFRILSKVSEMTCDSQCSKFCKLTIFVSMIE